MTLTIFKWDNRGGFPVLPWRHNSGAAAIISLVAAQYAPVLGQYLKLHKHSNISPVPRMFRDQQLLTD